MNRTKRVPDFHAHVGNTVEDMDFRGFAFRPTHLQLKSTARALLGNLPLDDPRQTRVGINARRAGSPCSRGAASNPSPLPRGPPRPAPPRRHSAAGGRRARPPSSGTGRPLPPERTKWRPAAGGRRAGRGGVSG